MIHIACISSPPFPIPTLSSLCSLLRQHHHFSSHLSLWAMHATWSVPYTQKEKNKTRVSTHIVCFFCQSSGIKSSQMQSFPIFSHFPAGCWYPGLPWKTSTEVGKSSHSYSSSGRQNNSTSFLSLQRLHVLIPGVCEYVNFHGIWTSQTWLY